MYFNNDTLLPEARIAIAWGTPDWESIGYSHSEYHILIRALCDRIVEMDKYISEISSTNPFRKNQKVLRIFKLLKTLREAELEDEVYSLKREVSILIGKLDYPSVYDYSNVTEMQFPNTQELHRIVQTTYGLNSSRANWQMEGVVIPKDKRSGYSYAYYINPKIIVDTHYLQEILVSQHEKIIRNIIADNKNSS